jgi:hypothetical protein
VLALILVGLFIPLLLVVGRLPIGPIAKEGGWLVPCYGILLIALTTWASRDCFMKMEIRS